MVTIARAAPPSEKAKPALMSPDTKPPPLQPKRAVDSTESGAQVVAARKAAVDAPPDDALAARFSALRYLAGFGNQFESEALPGALPAGRNNPRVCPYGLYAEQLTGTAFTAPRRENQRSWLYRIKPSATHHPFVPCDGARTNPVLVSDFSAGGPCDATPNQLRWRATQIPEREERHVDWVQGLATVCGSGAAADKTGFAIHMYAANSSMERCAFANADGDLLIVPQQGRLWLTTEFGLLAVQPGEIAVLQQGVRFAVRLPDGPSRGYVCEIYGGHFQLPDLGPIGANGLANPRDFQTPVAWFEEGSAAAASDAGVDAVQSGGAGAVQSGGGYVVVHKFAGRLFEASQDFSPFNVVAWHGNYAPYKYDLHRFCPMNAVAFDHPDPSIFTVLTCPTARPGVAAVDFVVFPPRWAVAEGTFRPPYFHRNCMSEFMGLIAGTYEAKAEGFEPGGASLHSCMTPHGPDAATFERAVAEEGSGEPERVHEGSLAFMLESCFTPRVTRNMLASPLLDAHYYQCWQGLRSHFRRPSP
ncbi:hypothetical protein CLOM_g6905 [Closterium sp. NIES-68]|nr:hypothetical protein CLOM_g6905 [Closterium sp. NIES-68]GJP84936.1 hypothetical protein CLOP_g14982 [Closterium sp. NIES-67]